MEQMTAQLQGAAFDGCNRAVGQPASQYSVNFKGMESESRVLHD